MLGGAIRLDVSSYTLDEITTILKLALVNKAFDIVGCDGTDFLSGTGQVICAEKQGKRTAMLVDMEPRESSIGNIRGLCSLDFDSRIYVYTREPTARNVMGPIKRECRWNKIELWTPDNIGSNIASHSPHLAGFIYMLQRCECDKLLEFMHVFSDSVQNAIDSKQEIGETSSYRLELRLPRILWELKDSAASLHKVFKHLSGLLNDFQNDLDINLSYRLLILLPRYMSEIADDILPRLLTSFQLLQSNYSGLTAGVMAEKRQRSPIYNIPGLYSRLKGHLPGTGVPAISEQLDTDLIILRELRSIGDLKSVDYSAISILDGAVSFLNVVSQAGNGAEFFVDAVHDALWRENTMDANEENSRETLVELMLRFADTRASTMPNLPIEEIQKRVMRMSSEEVERRLRESDFRLFGDS